MLTAPSGKRFIHKFTIDIKQRICQNRICKHILFSNFANHFHEYLLTFNQFFDFINGETAIWKLHSAKQRFKITSIKYRYISKTALVNSEERLIKTINEFLELLAKIIVGVFHIVPICHIFFPEIISPN